MRQFLQQLHYYPKRERKLWQLCLKLNYIKSVFAVFGIDFGGVLEIYEDAAGIATGKG